MSEWEDVLNNEPEDDNEEVSWGDDLDDFPEDPDDVEDSGWGDEDDAPYSDDVGWGDDDGALDYGDNPGGEESLDAIYTPPELDDTPEGGYTYDQGMYADVEADDPYEEEASDPYDEEYVEGDGVDETPAVEDEEPENDVAESPKKPGFLSSLTGKFTKSDKGDTSDGGDEQVDDEEDLPEWRQKGLLGLLGLLSQRKTGTEDEEGPDDSDEENVDEDEDGSDDSTAKKKIGKGTIAAGAVTVAVIAGFAFLFPGQQDEGGDTEAVAPVPSTTISASESPSESETESSTEPSSSTSTSEKSSETSNAGENEKDDLKNVADEFAQNLSTALNDQDPDKYVKLTSQASNFGLSDAKEALSNFPKGTVFTLRVENVVEKGDTVEVVMAYEVERPGSKKNVSQMTATLVQEGGEWKMKI